MKYAIILDNGRKWVKCVSDDYIDIKITDNNKRIFTLTLRNGKLYNQYDIEIKTDEIPF